MNKYCAWLRGTSVNPKNNPDSVSYQKDKVILLYLNIKTSFTVLVVDVFMCCDNRSLKMIHAN